MARVAGILITRSRLCSDGCVNIRDLSNRQDAVIRNDGCLEGAPLNADLAEGLARAYSFRHEA